VLAFQLIGHIIILIEHTFVKLRIWSHCHSFMFRSNLLFIQTFIWIFTSREGFPQFLIPN
jgi:hypothetical protein